MSVPLPPGSRLLHIGPHKTGTTALQGALQAAAGELSTHGVHFAGRDQQARAAASAVVKQRVLLGHPASDLDRWDRLLREVQGSGKDRVVISAEMFATATPERIEVIADGLGPRLQVVLTLRPLAAILPSQWQQYVQAGSCTGYDDWLRQVFDPAGGRPAEKFWWRHRHDELAARWAAVVGADRVTVIALDETDRTMNLRMFELLLDLPSGLLRAGGQPNRSLTRAEAELVRELNRQYKDARWPPDVYQRIVRYGMQPHLKARRPAAGEAAIITPDWAQQWVGEAAAAIVDGLATSGVNILGELASLLPAGTAADPGPDPSGITFEPAAMAVMGVLAATAVPADAQDEPARGGSWVSATPSSELLGVVARRALRRLPGRRRA